VTEPVFPRRAAVLGAALALALAACQEAPTPASPAAPGQAAPAPQSVSIETIAAQATGFSIGPSMSARTVYVFFDPQCPHCAALWQAARPLKSQARFVWVPVSLLNANSTLQGATLLAAADPIAAMDQHEELLRTQKGGIVPAQNTDAHKDAIKRNTQLMNSLNLSSVPAIVAKHAQTGELVVREGSMPTGPLAAALGLQAP
jgi:thiol:disulfide interchange protein DsbG